MNGSRFSPPLGGVTALKPPPKMALGSSVPSWGAAGRCGVGDGGTYGVCRVGDAPQVGGGGGIDPVLRAFGWGTPGAPAAKNKSETEIENKLGAFGLLRGGKVWARELATLRFWGTKPPPPK